jgi:hypothetical protein
LVFVTAVQTTSCGPNTGAHAVTCLRDQLNWYQLPNRPLAGYINFCPQPEGFVEDPKSVDDLIDTAVHELIHTLFMSPNLFPFFITTDGRPLFPPKCAPCLVLTVVLSKEGQMRVAGLASRSIKFAVFWAADDSNRMFLDLDAFLRKPALRVTWPLGILRHMWHAFWVCRVASRMLPVTLCA